jgi:hypothetical protein
MAWYPNRDAGGEPSLARAERRCRKRRGGPHDRGECAAAKSELQAADLITEVDGVKLNSDRDLQKEILRKKVGQVVQLTVWRTEPV